MLGSPRIQVERQVPNTRGTTCRIWFAFGVLPILFSLSLVALYRSSAHGERSDPLACLLILAITAVVMWLGQPGASSLLDRVVSPVTQFGRRAVVAFALGALILFLVTAYWALQTFPYSGDEIAYIMQAQTYARGQLWAEPPLIAEAFRQHRFYDIGGMWLSQYPPGWSLVLAPFVALRIPLWIVNPALGAVTLVTFFVLARRHLNRENAWLSMLILGLSAFYVFNSASYYNHSLATLCGILFVLFGERYQDRGRARDAIQAGVWLGVLGLTRTHNVLPFLLVFTFALLLSPKRRVGLLWVALGGAPFLVALLAYNNAITGDMLVPVQNWEGVKPIVPAPGEPSVGVEGHGREPLGEFGLETIRLTMGRLARLLTWTSPILLIGYALSFLFMFRRRSLSFADWIAPATGLLFLFYGGNGGFQYGPRYYFECWPFAILTLSKAAQSLLASQDQKRRDWTAAAVLTALTLQVAYLIPRSEREHRVVTERMAIDRAVAADGLHRAIVIVKGPVGATRPVSPQDVVRNGLDVSKQNIVFALDIPEERRRDLLAAYPGRKLYIYEKGRLRAVTNTQ